MGARQKLNVAFVNGAVVLAVFVGWLTGSWLIFVLTLIGLLAAGVYVGDIRCKK